MKVLVFSLLVAFASAQYFPAYGGYFNFNRSGYYPAPYAVSPYATPYAVQYAGQYASPIATQYHAQDEFGQASFGYAYPGQAAANYRDAAGNQIGSYAYINPDGKEIQVSYTADSNGFRVLSNALPVAPVNDLKAPVFDGKAPVFDGKAPEPVKDTDEVVAAKAEFNKLYKEAAAAAAANPEKPAEAPVKADTPVKVESARKKRQVVAVLPNKQFIDDLIYKSVDLNQDGQPDVPVYPAFVPAVKYVTPYVAPYVTPYVAPFAAKHVVKTVVAEADPSAKTPADTNKFNLKEKNFEVITPYAYPGYYPYSYPFYHSVAAAAPAADANLKVESSRKKRQVVAVLPDKQFLDDLRYQSVDLNQDGQPDHQVYPVLPAVKYVQPTPYVASYVAPYVAPFPFAAKHVVKTVVAEADPSAKTPADTNKFDLKEKNFEVITPYAYPSYYPYATYPFYQPVAADSSAPAAATPVKVESSRKKRQIPFYPTSNLFRDFAYNSVDLNRDGQPDQALYTAPFAYQYPSYPFYNRYYY